VAASKIPARIVWAVDTLGVKPLEHVLEIGCGHGFAVALLCDQPSRGRLTAIDRSRKMIEAAQKRNRAAVAARKVQFETVALADADLARQRFSRIFAINVDLFWIDPSRELPVVRRLLKPGGALYLFYRPPSPAQVRPVATKLSRNLEAGGFAVDQVIAGRAPGAGRLCVVARQAKSAA
jgi:SAM-dependent methyltransferase